MSTQHTNTHSVAKRKRYKVKKSERESDTEFKLHYKSAEKFIKNKSLLVLFAACVFFGIFIFCKLVHKLVRNLVFEWTRKWLINLEPKVNFTSTQQVLDQNHPLRDLTLSFRWLFKSSSSLFIHLFRLSNTHDAIQPVNKLNISYGFGNKIHCLYLCDANKNALELFSFPKSPPKMYAACCNLNERCN